MSSQNFDENKINSHLSYYNFFHIKTNEQWNELFEKNLAKYKMKKKQSFMLFRALNENLTNILEELSKYLYT